MAKVSYFFSYVQPYLSYSEMKRKFVGPCEMLLAIFLLFYCFAFLVHEVY